MPDLSDKDSAQSVKLVGGDVTTGIESNYVDATVNGLKVDGSAVTQPISAVSLPLPTGASTSANQTNGTQRTQITDGTNNVAVSNTVASLTAYGNIVRPIPYEPETFSAGTGPFNLAATATDIWTIAGSNTKTIRIHRIKFSATTTSGSAIKLNVSLIRRSTLDTGGTSATVTAAKHDSNNASATATVTRYTANPAALGTTVAQLRTDIVGVTGSGISGGVVDWDFESGGQPLILRGTSENIALNLNSITVTGGVGGVSVEWSEV